MNVDEKDGINLLYGKRRLHITDRGSECSHPFVSTGTKQIEI